MRKIIIEGCIIPNIKGLNHCPKGHSGLHERFFPLFAILVSEPIEMDDESNLSYLSEGLVRISGNIKQGNILEYEIRRVKNNNFDKDHEAFGLLNWTPTYIPVEKTY